ncbi:MAG TPA: hypothetical protein VGW12_05440 [Pyrinomonadaceae bacterium]|nr:hypothetical protein [Pyrinomonadaceae bacterium]
MRRKRRSLVFPREVLLVEIERHCAEASCNARTRIGLTKEEARLYDGFECERCERWNEDGLNERDIPDWWEELNITGLATLGRGGMAGDTASQSDEVNSEAGGVVARLSDAWQQRARREGRAGGTETTGDGGDEPL